MRCSTACPPTRVRPLVLAASLLAALPGAPWPGLPLEAQDPCTGAWKAVDLPASGNLAAFAGTGDGRLFAGLRSGGLAVWAPDPSSPAQNEWTQIPVGAGSLASGRVNDVVLNGSRLWVATQDAGVSTLDLTTGVWQTFHTANSSLPSNLVSRVTPLRAGTLQKVWLATGRGAALLDQRRAVGGGTVNVWTVVGQQQGLPGSAIDVAVFEAENGALFNYITDGAALYNWDSEAAIPTLHLVESTGDCRIASATRLANDATSLWLGGLERTVDQLNPNGPCRFVSGRFGTSWVDFPELTALDGRRVNDLCVDPDGRMWMGLTGRAAVHDAGTWCIFNPASVPLAGSTVTAVEAAGDGVWFGFSSGDQLSFFTPDWRTYQNTEAGAASNERILDISIQDDGVWLGLSRGISRFDGTSWEYEPLPSVGGALPQFGAMGRDRDGILWIGTVNHGLFAFDGTSFTHHQGNGLPAAEITDIACDSQGRLWVAGGGVTLRADGYWLNWNATNTPIPGTGSLGVVSLAIDPADRLWTGGSRGVNVLDPATGYWSHEAGADGFFDGGVRELAFEPSGALWAIGEGGAIRRDPASGEWDLFNAASGALPHNQAWHVATDLVGRVWIGTSRGLARLEAGDWQHFFASDTALPINEPGDLAAAATELWAMGRNVTSETVHVRRPADSPIGFSVPRIDSFEPAAAAPGEVVTIRGANFDASSPPENIVTFGPQRAGLFESATPPDPAVVLAATDGELQVRLPRLATSGRIAIGAHELTATSASTFEVRPAIATLSPTCLAPGDELVIEGAGFRGVPGSAPEIRIGSGAWRLPESADTYRIVDRLRPGDTAGPVRVRLANGQSSTSVESVTIGSLRITSFSIQQGAPYERSLVWGKRTLVHVNVEADGCDTRITQGTLYWRKRDGSRVLGSHAYLPGADGVSVPVPGGAAVTIDEDEGIDFVARFYVDALSELFPIGEFDGVEIVLRNGPVEVATRTISAGHFDFADNGAPLKLIWMPVVPLEGIPGTPAATFLQRAWENMAAVARIYPQQDVSWRWGPQSWINWTSVYTRTGMLDLDDTARYCEVKDRVDSFIDPDDDEVGIALVDGVLLSPDDPPGMSPVGGGPGGTGVAFNLEDTGGRITAHEIGHLLGLVHLFAANYDHDNPSPGHSRYDEGDDGCDMSLTFRTALNDQLGFRGHAVSLGEGAPVDLSGPGCGAAVGNSLMSYAPERDNVNALFEPLDYRHVYDAVVRVGSGGGGAGAAAEMLRLRGSVTEAGEARITVSYLTSTGTPSPPVPAGQYRMRILGAGDAVLLDHPFAASFQSSEGPVPIARFALRLPFPAGAQRVELRSGAQALWSRDVSAGPPSIALVSPAGGSRYGPEAPVPIRWNASDPDGDTDTLQFAIDFSLDGTRWERLNQYVTGSSWDWLPGVRPAGSRLRVRVRASDGFHTTTAISEPFAIEPSPPVALILSPRPGETFTEGENVDLVADALISSAWGATGPPPDGSFAWLLDGQLLEKSPGRSTRFALTGVGPKVVRLEVNDGPLQGSAEVTIQVLPDFDRDGMPNDWELAHRLSPLDPDNTRDDDDGDFLANLTECRLGTDPTSADSDGDRVGDGAELAAGTSPRDAGQRPAAGPILHLSERSLGFSWRPADLPMYPPDPIRVRVLSLEERRITWTAASSEPWLRVEPPSGRRSPDELTIVPDAAQLGPGVHHAEVLVTIPGAVNSPWPVRVTVEVIDETPPPGTFVRGDANSDGRGDISDAVFTLSWLFSGGATPRCARATDADDSGVIDLSDAVFLLDFLFRGGRGPSPPAPACGADPTADALDCDSFPPCE